MSFITDNAKDAFLTYIRSRITALFICSQEPATYTEGSSTYALGTKASPSVGAIGDYAGGRQFQRDAITDGSVNSTGTATHECLVDGSGSELLTARALTSSQSVTSGNTFSLTAAVVQVPDPI